MTGLMQPGPTRRAAEELRKRRGSQGLLGEIGEPLSYAPGPVGLLGHALLASQYLTGEKEAEEGLSQLAMLTALANALRVPSPIIRSAGVVGNATDYERRQIEAQRNAAKPVSEGGLGLPPNNTPEQRARALGFVTDAYHGTMQEIEGNTLRPGKFTIDRLLGVHAAKDPRVTDAFTVGGYARDTSALWPNPKMHLLAEDGGVIKPGGNVLPLKLRGRFMPIHGDSQFVGKYSVLEELDFDPGLMKGWLVKARNLSYSEADDIIRRFNEGKPVAHHGTQYKSPSKMVADLDPELFLMPENDKKKLLEKYVRVLKQEGFSGWKYVNQSPNEVGPGIDPTAYLVMDPTAIRSRFAAFDPMRAHEADIMGFADPRLLAAMGIGSGLLGGYLASERKKEGSPK